MKLFLFDVDGTLVDSQNTIVAAHAATFAAHGMALPSRARLLSLVGLSLPETFTVLAGADGPIESLIQGYKDAFNGRREDSVPADPLYPGAEACIDRFRARDDVRLGIATGKSRRGVRRLLDRQGWHHVFATIQTAEDAPSKPHPAMIEQAMAQTGAAAADTVMVGDSSFDMAMARAAGVLPIGVSWGFQPVQTLRAAGAKLIVDSYADLQSVLEEFLVPSNSAVRSPISSA